MTRTRKALLSITIDGKASAPRRRERSGSTDPDVVRLMLRPWEGQASSERSGANRPVDGEAA